jgi:putative MATE family efflux protein
LKPLISGHPAKELVFFSLALMAGDLLQLFYNVADTFIVGRTLGINALAAVSCSFGLIAFVFGFSIGLTNGFAIIMAQRYGAGDGEGLHRSIALSLGLCFVFGLALTLILAPLSRTILIWMRTPDAILDEAVQYIFVILCGITVTISYNMLSNILRALGDSRSPLYFLLTASVANVILTWLFIRQCNGGVSGAALATVLSELLSCVLCLWFIVKKYAGALPAKRHWRPAPGDVSAHLGLGISMGFQQSIVEAGNILVQAALNGLGVLTIAAISVAQRVRHMNMLPLFGLSRAITIYTAQNLGAGKIKRVYRGMVYAVLISLAFSGIMLFINLLFGAPISAWFLVNEGEAVGMAHTYLIYVGLTLFLLGVMLIFRSALQGLGKRISPTICSIMEMVMSVAAAFFLIPQFGFIGVCLANPLSWFASGIPLYIAFALFVRRQGRRQGRRQRTGVGLQSAG